MEDLITGTIKGIITALPFYVKNKKNLDRIITPINVLWSNERQSVTNALVSQYDHTLPYNYLTNQTEVKSLMPIYPDADNNLILNIRSKYGENVARYIFGYKPQETNHTAHKYYMFSETVPTNRNTNVADHFYVDSSCYDNFLVPKELCLIAESRHSHLLSIPILLKHWDHFSEYMNDSDELKKKVLADLKRLNCNEYCKMLEKKAPTYYSQPSYEFDTLSQYDSYKILYVYFLELEYDLIKKRLSNEEIGLLLYKIVGDTDLSDLNVKLPPIKNIQNIDNGNRHLRQAQFKDIQRPELPKRPIISRPTIPPPPIPKKLLYLQKDEDVDGHYDDVAPPKNNETISKKPKSLIDELSAFFKTRFTAGERYNYNQEKDDIKEIDCGKFPDQELDILKVQLPHLNKASQVKLGSVDELKYRLFANARVGNFLNTPNFMSKIKILHAILARNKHFFLEYRFKDYDIECFVVIDHNEIDAIRAYRLYFEMLKSLIFYMNENSSGSIASIPRENLTYIGLSILCALNNFGYYIFGDLLAFRNYIDGFYTLTKRLNQENTPIVSLYSSIHSVIHDFLDKTKLFVGGSEAGKTFDYQPYFDFFEHAFILDILRSHKRGNIRERNYLSETMNNDPLKLFWDGISFDQLYNTFNIEKKFLYTIIYETFFIDNKYDGSVFKTSYSSDMKSPRVVFLANKITDTLSTYQLLDNLSRKVVKDINNEVDTERLTNELEKIFGPDVIRNVDKLKVVKDPSQVPAFVRAVQEKNLNVNSVTMLETLLFFFVILEKLGFKVNKKFAKSNLLVTIEPALLKENIAQQLNAFPKTDLSNEFIEKYGTQLEYLLTNSLSYHNEMKAGSEVEAELNDNSTKTELLIGLPKEHSLNIDFNITLDNIEQSFLNKEGPLGKEIEDLNQGLSLMINSDEITEDTIHRLVPYYIKEQIRLTSDLPQETGGSIINNDNDIISIFLQKVEDISQKINMSVPLTEEMISKTVDKFLQEKYIQSMDKLIPFYDNKICVSNGRDKPFLLLKHTLDTINYMRTNIKIDFSDSIKMGLVNIIKLKQNSDEYCYKVFIIIQYIRHMIEELYNKLKIQPNNRTINFDEFSVFFKVINKKLKERDDNYKNLVSEKTLSYINKRLGTNYIDIPTTNFDKTFMEIFDPRIQKVPLIKNV